MKLTVMTGLSILVTFFLVGARADAAANWNWKAKPSKSQWKEFFALSTAQQESLVEKNRNLRFDEMDWEWRMAWVRACGQGNSPACGRVLQLGLFDKALVVRAEAASRIGDRFAGSGHAPAIRILRTAYSVQQNKRNGSPLFVQYRILHSLNKIGGEGVKVGKALALNQQVTKQYWSKLSVTDKKEKGAL